MCKIAHVADIHLRSLTRYDEYKYVLEDFTKKCQQHNVDHVMICGDVFHTKTQNISPEYIDFLSLWLKQLATVAKVHIVLGNHDGIISNLNRQDAVSPIVNAINSDSIVVYKKSGVYPFEPGYNFCVLSIFDEEGWERAAPIPGDFNVGCYHGPVIGCKSESDWELTRGLPLETFEDFDITMLGDIHKLQYLSYKRQATGDVPNIAYPGSVLQQNYQEAIDHGFLLWNIQSKEQWNVEFVKLPNVKPFYTLVWAGDETEFEAATSTITNNSRIRVKSNVYVTKKDVDTINKILQRFSPVEVVFKVDAKNTRSITKQSEVISKKNLRNPTVLCELIKKYHTKNETISDDALYSIVNKLLLATTEDEDARNSTWSIKELQFDNLFGYGPGNKLSFENLHGITGVFAPNAAGKSSIIGTLLYSLFNVTDRPTVRKQHLCNTRHMKCSSKVRLSTNNEEYEISRTLEKVETKRGVQNSLATLDLVKVEADGSRLTLNADGKTDTEKLIRSLLGNADDLMYTSFSVQGQGDVYINQGASRRNQILTRMLKLDLFEKLHKLINEEAKSLKSRLKQSSQKDCDVEAEVIKSEIETLHAKITETDALLQQKQLEASELKERFSLGAAVIVTDTDVAVQTNRVQQVQSSIKKTEEALESICAKLKSNAERLQKMQQLKVDYDIIELKKQQIAKNKLSSERLTAKHELETAKTRLKTIQDTVVVLGKVPCHGEYPDCKFIKTACENSSLEDGQKQLVDSLLIKYETVNEKLTELLGEDVDETIEKLSKLDKMINDVMLSNAEQNLQTNKRTEEKNRLVEKLQQETTTLEKLSAAVDTATSSASQEYNVILSKIKSLDVEKAAAFRRLGSCETQLETIEKEGKNKKQLLEQLKTAELIAVAFSKKGIPNQLLTAQLPVINAEIAKTLSGTVPFTVEFSIAENDDDVDLYIVNGPRRRLIELSSGMEKMISSIAIRVALSNVSELPKCDMFVIDEGFGALDPQQLEKCLLLISSLTQHFSKVLIVSHVDYVKDAVDNVVEIIKPGYDEDAMVNA
jgi:DNA repair exonuclease SbcCD ATPase subunit/DNA repair exonuclease SbcCD nuclease subunit